MTLEAACAGDNSRLTPTRVFATSRWGKTFEHLRIRGGCENDVTDPGWKENFVVRLERADLLRGLNLETSLRDDGGARTVYGSDHTISPGEFIDRETRGLLRPNQGLAPRMLRPCFPSARKTALISEDLIEWTGRKIVFGKVAVCGLRYTGQTIEDTTAMVSAPDPVRREENKVVSIRLHGQTEHVG